MTPFEKFYNSFKVKEGGLSNNPNDYWARFPSPTPQKYHTNKGVTWYTFINSAKKIGYSPTVENFLKMPDAIHRNIIKKEYWDKFLLDQIPGNVAIYLGDIAAWSGVAQATVTLQTALNNIGFYHIRIDGVFGEKTFKALKDASFRTPLELIKAMSNVHIASMEKFQRREGTWEAQKEGLLSRANKTLNEALTFISQNKNTVSIFLVFIFLIFAYYALFLPKPTI